MGATRSRSRLLVLVLCLGVGLAGYVLGEEVFQQAGARVQPQTTDNAILGTRGIDHPLRAGEPVSVDAAEQALEKCNDCPRVPDSGPAAAGNVSSAWVDDFGGVGLTYENGAWAIFTPDDRTAEEYLVALGDVTSSKEWPFDVIDFRGTKAIAADVNANGPAAISWVEGGYLWQVVGMEGPALSDLLELARAL